MKFQDKVVVVTGAGAGMGHELVLGLLKLLETKVGVSVVLPGAIATDIAVNSGVHMDAPEDAPAHKSLPAHEAATIILDGIESDDLHITVGSDSKMMMLANRIAPESSIRLIQRQMRDLLHHD